nr:MAG TPA: hypothetical protein [Caudoviricetes sp.]
MYAALLNGWRISPLRQPPGPGRPIAQVQPLRGPINLRPPFRSNPHCGWEGSHLPSHPSLKPKFTIL